MQDNTGAVLSKNDIRDLLNSSPPLVENPANLEEQLQPNGIDLTLRDIARLSSRGTIGQRNAQRVLSSSERMVFDENGFVNLTSGEYLITLNEIVHLPLNIMALAKPRSSLLRCGVAIHNAVWDAGYEGRSQALMVVYNRNGFQLQQDARVLQLVFFRLFNPSEGYKGYFQRENMV
ncbi:MAG: deoxyuridine 5'-triphosphate nucleotidohydrolase [Dehalococcoidia bacterium]|nr:deoxyuridine 5'-triphosphate nucleotidohydrolase [Dehalococcoidia bacterium]